MATDTEVYRTAGLLIREYGDMAPAGAFIKADEMADKGDQRGRSIWLRIGRAAEDLLSEDQPKNERPN